MNDLIKRQDAIDALKKIMFTHLFECGEYIGEDSREFSIMNAKKALDIIKNLPSEELERKNGRWIYLNECANAGYYCDQCNKRVVKDGWSKTVKKINFCPNCGAEMREEHEDIPMEYFENGGI